MRGFTSKEILEKAFKMERVNIPTAPSLNLLLEEVRSEKICFVFYYSNFKKS